MKTAASAFAPNIDTFLKEHLFAGIFSRAVLTYQQRELATISVLSALEYGSGQPTVSLHGGIFGSAYEMYRFIDSFSKSYQVIAISTRGHGKSELGTAPINYEQEANDVLAVINAVTKNSVIVLGSSDAAYAGYKLASMYSQKVKKLIAIGATELHPGLRDFSFDVKQALSLDSVYWQQRISTDARTATITANVYTAGQYV